MLQNSDFYFKIEYDIDINSIILFVCRLMQTKYNFISK